MRGCKIPHGVFPHPLTTPDVPRAAGTSMRTCLVLASRMFPLTALSAADLNSYSGKLSYHRQSDLPKFLLSSL